jgi:hypothetical protein
MTNRAFMVVVMSIIVVLIGFLVIERVRICYEKGGIHCKPGPVF